MGASQARADPWERWGALSGYVFVIAALFALILDLAAGTPRNGSPFALGRFIHNHRTALEVAWYAGLLAGFSAFLWLITLVSAFRRSLGAWNMLLLVLACAGSLAIGLHLAADALQAVALFYTPDRTTSGVTYGFYTAGSVLLKVGGMSAGIALSAIAFLTFHSGDFPRRLGWIALGAGAFDTAGNILSISIPWFGYVAGIGLIGLLFVVVDTSDIMLRSRKGR